MFSKLQTNVNRIAKPALDTPEYACGVIETQSYIPTTSLMSEILQGDYVSKNMRVKPPEKHVEVVSPRRDRNDETDSQESSRDDFERKREQHKMESVSRFESDKKSRRRR
jgi:hypothetical protein